MNEDERRLARAWRFVERAKGELAGQESVSVGPVIGRFIATQEEVLRERIKMATGREPEDLVSELGDEDELERFAAGVESNLRAALRRLPSGPEVDRLNDPSAMEEAREKVEDVVLAAEQRQPSDDEVRDDG